MTIVIAVAAALVTGIVVAAFVVAHLRRTSAAVPDPADDLRVIHHDLGRLMESLRSGFARSEQTQDTVRSTLDMLTHNTGRRGTWGEVTLRRLLEASGLTHRCDFDTQRSLDGGGRPDVLIDLGPGGTVIVDAKAPLAALRRSWEADDDETRDLVLREHAATVRRHAADLVARDYPSQVDAAFAPVVMYLPVDGAWEAADAVAPGLAGELVRTGIHPASPTTLGLVLEVLKQHALSVDQEETVRTVLEEARRLATRMTTHADHLGKLGRALTTAVGAYNDTVGNFAKRVVPSTNRIGEHIGAHAVDTPAEVGASVRSDEVDEVTLDQRVA